MSNISEWNRTLRKHHLFSYRTEKALGKHAENECIIQFASTGSSSAAEWLEHNTPPFSYLSTSPWHRSCAKAWAPGTLVGYSVLLGYLSMKMFPLLRRRKPTKQSLGALGALWAKVEPPVRVQLPPSERVSLLEVGTYQNDGGFLLFLSSELCLKFT